MDDDKTLLTVLAIDGCNDTLEQLQDLLHDNYRLQLAPSGSEGLAAARQHRPDAILIAIDLPDANGFDICRQLKAEPATATAPVIFLSSHDKEDEHDRVFRVGGADLVRKPLRRVELQSRVDNQIRMRMNERLIRRRALYDDLTNLPCRTLSHDRLGAALEQDRRNQRMTALLYIDLDDFKTINDSLGHEAGDQLLKQAALRFQQQLRQGDTVGRLGGDEFVIILSGLGCVEDAKAIAENVLRAFEQPFSLNGVTTRAGISIGVALAPDDSDDASKLMACADTAMYQAKKQGRGRIRFYTTMMNLDVARRVTLERNLHQAIARGEMFLHYQPVLDMARGQIISGEALLRWRSPTLGPVGPEEFVSQAEHSGLIWEIGEFALRQACTDFRALSRRDGQPLRLSINISPQQLRRADFAALVETVLKDTAFAPERLEIEVTEKLLFDRGRVTEDNLHRLSEMGVRLSMDDFGTGLSSLSYLSQHHFDLLKIDRQFVEGMVINPDHDKLVSACIAMAGALRMRVVAEGVETAAQMAALRARNCHMAQGNFISRPVPLQRFRDDVLEGMEASPQRPHLHLVQPHERGEDEDEANEAGR